MNEERYNVYEDAEGGVVDFAPLDPEGDDRPDELEVQGTLSAMAEEAYLWREHHLDPFQAEATRYYFAKPFGDEDEDRSQVVIPVVRNAVRQTMPSLLRVFFGPEHTVEFSPRNEEDVPIAEEQTDFVNQIVVQEDNPGFLIFHDWMKDALVRRIGIVKWWWERKTSRQTEVFEPLTLEEVTALAAEFEAAPGIEYGIETEEIGADPETGDPLYRASVTETITDGRARFAAVPPEEVIWSPQARSKYDARLIGHVRDVPADELIAMGVPEEVVERHAGETRPIHSDEVEDERRGGLDAGVSITSTAEDEQDDATRPTQYAELYARIDVDGDGIAELRLFKCVGIRFEIVNEDEAGLPGEPVDTIPFAFLSPDPEPHAFVGLGQADSTMPLQRIQSYVTRGMLDSLAESIDPVKVVNPRRVNMQDVMSRKLARVIRTNDDPQTAVVPFKQPWVGGDALPVLEYLNHETEKAVGMPALTAGLEADALQSSTQEGVRATVEGAQQQLELVARIFAETGVKDLFRGLLKLIVDHKNETRRRIVRLRGQYVEPDLDRWDATMDVRINVALGNGLVQERIRTLERVLAFQMEMIQLGAPIVTWAEIRATMAKVIELSGQPDVNTHLRPWGAQEQAMWEQQQAQDGNGDPAALLAQVEMQKVEQDREEAAAKLALEREKMMMEDDRERDKAAQDFALKSEELRLKYTTQELESQLRAATEARRAEMDADIRAREVEQQGQLEAQDQILNAPGTRPGLTLEPDPNAAPEGGGEETL